ncbi:hypothetical protein K1719_020073 [Acacia pycnantha]|nr:hypothetical protein K1719_020073 [Acacia pycnantha]
MTKKGVDCAQKRPSIHGKKKTSSNVPSSFFKVMIGSDFSSVLYLPPKFGPTASTLIDKEAIIEDSSGKQWKVQISIVDKSYAFQEGWKAFSLEHGLEVGHFLVFNYMGRSHFVVKVFDRSGCEKTDFPNQRKQKKRKTITVDLDDSDELLNRQGLLSSESDTGKTHSQDEVVGVEDSAEINKEKTSENSNSNRGIRSLNEDKNYEDPCYLKDRDFGDKEREDRDSLMFDAFMCEILNNSGVHRTGKFTSSNEIVVTSIYTKDPLLEDMLGNGATQDLFEVELTERSHFLEELDKSTFSCERHSRENKIPEHLLIPCTMQHEEIKENSETQRLLISEEGYPLHAGNCANTKEMLVGLHVSLDVPMCHVTGKMERMIQKELLDMTPDVCIYKDQLQTLIGYQSSDLNSAKAVPSDCEEEGDVANENRAGQQGEWDKMDKGVMVSGQIGQVSTGQKRIIHDNALADKAVRRSSRIGKPSWKLRERRAAHMLASISETDSKDNATGGAPEDTMADPLP